MEQAAKEAAAKAAESRARASAETDSYSTFKTKYLNDPAGFVLDCIEWKPGECPAQYQIDILKSISSHRRISVRGPHGLGKSAMASWIILWFALTRDGTDWKVVTTASAWRQLIKYLWPEVHKWSRRFRWDVIGRAPFSEHELLSLNVKLSTGEAFAVASDNSDLIEGAHADNILYVFDEAKAIPDRTWDAAEGAFASGNCYSVAISTPGEPVGRFYDIQSHKAGYEDWLVRRVTLDDAMTAGRINADWAEKRKRQWGESSAQYKNRVLGEFASSDAEGVIPLSWIEAANERWEQWVESGRPGIFTGVGVDVGGGLPGSDKTVLALCYNMMTIGELRKYPLSDPHTATMETAGRVAGLLKKEHSGEAIIDVVGIGAGTLHRLCEIGLPARGFNAGKGTNFTDKSGELGFANWRSAAWWIMREMLEPDSGFNVMLPPDDELTGDLTAPKSMIVSGGRERGGVIRVESKESIRKRINRSTDCGDAVIQILVGPLLCDEDSQVAQSQVIYQPEKIGPDY